MSAFAGRLSVTLAEIDEQRAKGWVDFHPEDWCHRCGGRNVQGWYAPSPLWNAVAGDPTDPWEWQGIICPQCFTELAAERGIVDGAKAMWKLALSPRTTSLLVELPTTDKSGRTWDAVADLWIEPCGTPGDGRGTSHAHAGAT